MVSVVCSQCKKSFTTHAAWIKKGGGKFCSRICCYNSQKNKPIQGLKNLSREFMTGKKHHLWKETNYTYATIHIWLSRWYKKEKCELCGAQERLEWANKTGKYLRSRDDFWVLCIKCHRNLDHKEPRGKMGYLKIEGKYRRIQSVQE